MYVWMYTKNWRFFIRLLNLIPILSETFYFTITWQKTAQNLVLTDISTIRLSSPVGWDSAYAESLNNTWLFFASVYALLVPQVWDCLFVCLTTWFQSLEHEIKVLE